MQQQQQHHMMQQQQQQQHQMMQMMQMMQGIMTPPAPPVRVPTPPLPTVATRQPSAVERNPWAAPPPPLPSIAAGGCDLCTSQNNHICLHSALDNSVSSGSDRPLASPGPAPAARVFQLPPEQPEGAVDRWVAAQSRQSDMEVKVTAAGISCSQLASVAVACRSTMRPVSPQR